MDGVDVRVERPGDRSEAARIRAVLQQAFGRDDEADLVESLRADTAWLPHLALVAAEAGHGRLTGYVAGTRLDVGGAPAVALAPLAVLPSRQGRGIGSRLVRVQLDRARGAGERVVVVLGEPGYYSRFGFRPAAAIGLDGPYASAGEAFQALVLGDAEPPRGWVTYPAPFGA